MTAAVSEPAAVSDVVDQTCDWSVSIILGSHWSDQRPVSSRGQESGVTATGSLGPDNYGGLQGNISMKKRFMEKYIQPSLSHHNHGVSPYR